MPKLGWKSGCSIWWIWWVANRADLQFPEGSNGLYFLKRSYLNVCRANFSSKYWTQIFENLRSKHAYLLRECKYEKSLICFDGKLFHRAVVILPKVRMWQHVGGKENDGSNALLVEAWGHVIPSTWTSGMWDDVATMRKMCPPKKVIFDEPCLKNGILRREFDFYTLCSNFLCNRAWLSLKDKLQFTIVLFSVITFPN